MFQTNLFCIWKQRDEASLQNSILWDAYYVDMLVAYYATTRMMSLPSHIYANAIFMVPAENLKYKYAGCRQNNAFNPDVENITFLHQVRIPILSNQEDSSKTFSSEEACW